MPTRRRQPDRAHLSHRRRALSMLEILVVFSLVLFVLAILLPGLGEAKERARRLMCENNLHQWGAAGQYYRDENLDYLPTEGTYLNPDKPYAWFDVLPPYLDAPRYREIEGVGVDIREFQNVDIWICPSKQLSDRDKSGSGKNRFHYGMNEVFDGVTGTLTPGFPDMGELPIPARRYSKKPQTVFMFDIYRADSHGNPKDVATRFHRDYANVLYLTGAVGRARSADFVVDGDFKRATPVWSHPRLYWGYLPPPVAGGTP